MRGRARLRGVFDAMTDAAMLAMLLLAWWYLRRHRGWVDLPRYYKTAHWIAIRNQKRREGHYRCERCGSKERLEVHHITYARLYHERMNDLQLLCRFCHTRGSGVK